MTASKKPDVTAAVQLNGVVSTSIEDSRQGSVELFRDLSPRQQIELAQDTWHVGLRALQNAYRQADAARLQDVGSELIAEVDRALRTHAERHNEQLEAAMKLYLDPSSGHVAKRMTEFVSDQGAFARFFEGYVGANGQLSKTLGDHLGKDSQLFKLLSSSETGNVVDQITTKLEEALKSGQAQLGEALDPLKEGGAVNRFLGELQSELRKKQADQSEQLKVALSALDANDDTSLLSRLVRETHNVRREVLTAMNPESPTSPLAIVKRSLTELLETRLSRQEASIKAVAEEQKSFHTDMLEVVTRIETKKAAAAKSARGGTVFEDDVTALIAELTRDMPIFAEETGSIPGRLPRCKKGDLVLRFTEESAFSGSGVVVEAKQDASYTIKKAIDEQKIALENREAAASLFVMSRSHAPRSFPELSRHGRHVLCVWDAKDPSSDIILRAGLILSLALVTTTKKSHDAADLSALADVEKRIRDEISRYRRMQSKIETIQRAATALTEEIRKGEKKLDTLLTKAQSTAAALSIELATEEAELASPIALALPSDDDCPSDDFLTSALLSASN